MPNALESRTRNEKKVFGYYSKKATAEQNTKNNELSLQLLFKAQLRKVKQQQKKGWVTVSRDTEVLNTPQPSASSHPP